MKLSKNKIPKLLKSKYQSRKQNNNNNNKNKRCSNKRNTFRKKRITNLRQKSLKKKLQDGGGEISKVNKKNLDRIRDNIDKLKEKQIEEKEVIELLKEKKAEENIKDLASKNLHQTEKKLAKEGSLLESKSKKYEKEEKAIQELEEGTKKFSSNFITDRNRRTSITQDPYFGRGYQFNVLFPKDKNPAEPDNLGNNDGVIVSMSPEPGISSRLYFNQLFPFTHPLNVLSDGSGAPAAPVAPVAPVEFCAEHK